MATKVGVGFCNKADSFLAGQEAANLAMESLCDTKGDLVLTFCNGKHNPHQFLEGVRSVTGNSLLLGGAAMGVFTNTELCYEEYEANVTVFKSDTIRFQLFAQPDLDKNEVNAGAKLAQQIVGAGSNEDRGLIVLYDTVKKREPIQFNFATPLFAAIEEVIDPEICCVGCGLIGDMQLNHGFQFFNDSVLQQHVTALLISGDCVLHNAIMHGCKPASSYKTITRAEGPVVYEIDNRPALEVIEELFTTGQKVPWEQYPLFVTLGLNKGDKFGEFKEEDYANRLCLAIDREKKALIMFEPDLISGDQIQLMHRSINLKYIQSGIDKLKAKSDNRKPICYLYINCAGRAKPFVGGELEDVDEIQKILGGNIPLTGFYSGVEIAKVRNRIQALDWTGILCMLVED